MEMGERKCKMNDSFGAPWVTVPLEVVSSLRSLNGNAVLIKG